MIMPSALYHTGENLVLMSLELSTSPFELGCYHIVESHATSSNLPPDQERESTKCGVTKDLMKTMPHVIYQIEEEEKTDTLQPSEYPIKSKVS